MDANTSPSSPPARILAVLGMHRSGTSWLAGSLEASGLDLGEVPEFNEHNRKGNRESPVLQELHKGVLRANDGSWKKPPSRPKWPATASEQLATHIAAMNRSGRRWGFKDPRALLLLDEWRRLAGDALEFVGIYRHPLAVHASLSRRNSRFDEKRSVRLWCVYNERLVQEHRALGFPMLRFGIEPDELLKAYETMATQLGFDAPTEVFFEQTLVHNNAEASRSVPRACRKLWAYLEEARLRP